MVQIILQGKYVRVLFKSLFYIPHGSDNTSVKSIRIVPASVFYIPHGSDNTWQAFFVNYYK